jgi:uncharacterized cofD-like protein
LTRLYTSGIVETVQNSANGLRSNGHPQRRWRLITRWLEPGLGVKRWIAVLTLGTTLIGLGMAVILLDIYRAYPDSPFMAFLSLRALPRELRALLLGGVGVLVVVWSIFRLNRTLLAPYVRPGHSVVEAVSEHRRLGRGPKIVAIGGGTGLSTLLRGLKVHTGNLTAIVSVADDGGSSGRLRRSLGLPPPGDIRACIAALSLDEALLTQLFQYRFREGEELGGHSFGNLFIAALSSVTGSFEGGVVEAGRLLGIRGQVIPATASEVGLLADKTLATMSEAVRIEGESRITDIPGRIKRVQLEPNDPPAYPLAIQAILNADMIVIGPGSLFTSVLPNLLVPDIVKAIEASRAYKIFVCNVATQPGETDHLDCCNHVEAISIHIGSPLVDLVVANDRILDNLPEGVEAVDPSLTEFHACPLYTADLVDMAQPTRHDASKLAQALIALLEEHTGPLEWVTNGETPNSRSTS